MSIYLVFLILNAGLFALLLFVMLARGVEVWRLMRRETYAMLLGRDRSRKAIVKINPNERWFEHKKKAYNITEPYLRYGWKRFILYVEGRADPIDVLSKENSRLDAETYHAIIKNEIVKALQKPSGMFSNMDWKKIAIIGLLIIAAIYLIRGGSVV